MPTSKPNLLFIFSDQQHWQAVGFQDPTFDTPNLNRLAADGVVFNEAFCTTPQCSPSRSSILTGLYPSKTGVIGNIGAAGGNSLEIETIGPVLQKAGYQTAYFGKWHLGKDPRGTAGWDEDLGVTGPEVRDDDEVTRRAIQFLENPERNAKPFALFLSYVNPHDIYQFRKELNPAPHAPIDLPASWHEQDFATVPSVQGQFLREDGGKTLVGKPAPAWKRYRELYREKVKCYDDEVGKVMRVLERDGFFASTLIMVTSDHGDMDTNHRLVYKGPFMYEHMMRVPMIVRLPDALTHSKTSKTIDFPTVNVDLAPTLADFAGTTLTETDGVSLKPLLTGEGLPPQRDFVIGQYYSKQRWVNPIRMIRTQKNKFVHYAVYGQEFYDLANDPNEIRNREKDHAYAQNKQQLSDKLEKWMKQNDDDFHNHRPTTRSGEPISPSTPS